MDIFEDGPSGDERHDEIRRYLKLYALDHAHGSDTLTGIAGWWLPPAAKVTLPELQQVVDELVAEGVLTRSALPGDKWLYSIARKDR